MKIILDRLLDVFIWVYGIFLYSLVLPLTLGVILIFIVPIADWFNEIPIIIKIPSFILIGAGLKFLHTKKNIFNVYK